MKLGFTGSREGWTILQSLTISVLLADPKIEEVHHGDCVGSDQQLDSFAAKLKIKRVVHPPNNSTLRAFCKGEVVLGPSDYMSRNMDIITSSDKLIATPDKMDGKGGTWATINMARTFKKEVIVINPDGSYTTYPKWSYL